MPVIEVIGKTDLSRLPYIIFRKTSYFWLRVSKWQASVNAIFPKPLRQGVSSFHHTMTVVVWEALVDWIAYICIWHVGSYINYIQSYLIYILLIINNFILRYIFNFSSNIIIIKLKVGLFTLLVLLIKKRHFRKRILI